MGKKKENKIVRIELSGKNPELFNKLFDKLISAIELYFDTNEDYDSDEFKQSDLDVSSLKKIGENTFKEANIEDEEIKANIIKIYSNIEFKKNADRRKNESAKIDNLKKIKEEQLKDIKTKCGLIKALVQYNQVVITKDQKNFIENVEMTIISNL